MSGVFLNNNQPVTAGQDLFQIDIERYQFAVDNAKATVDSAQASLERSRQGALHMRKIREENPGAISQRQLETAEASFAAARSKVDATKSSLDKAKLKCISKTNALLPE